MKTRFYMLNLLAGIALATFSLMSCGKGAFLDTDDPATRGFTLDTFKPIDPIEPPLILKPTVICLDSNNQVVDSPLSIGIAYTFKMELFGIDIDDVPQIGLVIKDSTGENVSYGVVGGLSVALKYTFTLPGEYTVFATVTYKSGPIVYKRVYKVIGTGFDTRNPKLNVPFKLRVNPLSTGKPVLSVSETLFNDPQCTIRELEYGYFEICIKEPGKYKFNVGHPDLGVFDAGAYHANVFYRPNLLCRSEAIRGRGYTNRLQVWTSSDLQIPWFRERIAFSCYTTGHPELAKDYTANKDDSYVEIANSSSAYMGNVYIREYSSQYPYPSPNSWTVVYPRDTCYYHNGMAELK